MFLRTKIVATVGPACSGAERLAELARAGVDVFRVNFSHGDQASRAEAIDNIRAVEADLGRPLAIMADLCGPKIRVGPMAGGAVMLATGETLTIGREPVEGTAGRISTTLAELIDSVAPGQTLLLDEGNIRLKTVEVRPPGELVCDVTLGGLLGSGKGVHLPETELRLPALTEKDRADAAWLSGREIDFVALSFVQRPEDIEDLRKLVDDGVEIVAKIEKPQAMDRIDDILAAADALMVARGDLGVEMPLEQVPMAQKRLAALCRANGKCCIVATQMLESMTTHPAPTRAEAADVANAVLDGADAVMLSGETAVGAWPVQAVETMRRIAAEAEQHELKHPSHLPARYAPARTTAALAAAVREVIAVEDVAALAVYTATGATATVLAQERLGQPILAMAPTERVVRQMNLTFGVRGVLEKAPEHTRNVLAAAERHLKQLQLAREGQKIVVLTGRPIGRPGATNTMVVHGLD